MITLTENLSLTLHRNETGHELLLPTLPEGESWRLTRQPNPAVRYHESWLLFRLDAAGDTIAVQVVDMTLDGAGVSQSLVLATGINMLANDTFLNETNTNRPGDYRAM